MLGIIHPALESKMDDEYQTNLESLVTARTEQLIAAVALIHELVEGIKPFRPDLANKATDILEQGLNSKSA
jgi:hypothetical protein